MRIVNQRRDISLNFDLIGLFLEADCIYTVLDGKNRILGRYTSEERAQEVFVDIHSKFSRGWLVYDMSEE